MYYLLAIEEVINTTLLSCLLLRVTLNEVWFGYKAWGPLLKVRDNGDKITESNKGEEEKEEKDPNNEDKAFLLTKLLELNWQIVRTFRLLN